MRKIIVEITVKRSFFAAAALAVCIIGAAFLFASDPVNGPDKPSVECLSRHLAYVAPDAEDADDKVAAAMAACGGEHDKND